MSRQGTTMTRILMTILSRTGIRWIWQVRKFYWKEHAVHFIKLFNRIRNGLTWKREQQQLSIRATNIVTDQWTRAFLLAPHVKDDGDSYWTTVSICFKLFASSAEPVRESSAEIGLKRTPRQQISRLHGSGIANENGWWTSSTLATRNKSWNNVWIAEWQPGDKVSLFFNYGFYLTFYVCLRGLCQEVQTLTYAWAIQLSPNGYNRPSNKRNNNSSNGFWWLESLWTEALAPRVATAEAQTTPLCKSTPRNPDVTIK